MLCTGLHSHTSLPVWVQMWHICVVKLICPTSRTLAETEGLPDNCSDTAQSGSQPGEAGLFTTQNNEQVAEDQTKTAVPSPKVCKCRFTGASFTASSAKVLQKTQFLALLFHHAKAYAY